MEKYGVHVIGYGKHIQYSPVKIKESWLLVPITYAFDTIEEAIKALNVRGYSCSAIGDVYQLLSK